jgi:hypothetical protein
MMVFTPRANKAHVISLRKANKREVKRIPALPHVPRKFTRPSHLGFGVGPNPLFSSLRSTAVWVRFPSPAPLFVVWRVPALSGDAHVPIVWFPTVSMRLQPVF